MKEVIELLDKRNAMILSHLDNHVTEMNKWTNHVTDTFLDIGNLILSINKDITELREEMIYIRSLVLPLG